MTLAQSQTTPSPQLEAIGLACTGLLAGCLLAWAIAAVLSWRNLRGSFALPLSAFGYVLLVGAGDVFYGCLFLSGGAVGAFTRFYWIRQDIKAGGELARTAREARGIRELLRNRRERHRVIDQALPIQGSSYALGTDPRGAVVWGPLGLREGRHLLLIGATGAGKTTSMLWSLFRHLEGGCAAIVIDPKGDPELIRRCRREADWRQRAFYCFSLDRPEHHWNPLAWGTPSEQADKLIAAEEWTEPHYKRLYQRYLLNLFTAIEARDQVADLANTVELLKPDRLALFCRDIEDEATAKRLTDYLEDLTTDERRDLAGLRNRLALLVESEHGELLQPAEDPIDDADLLLAIRSSAVVVFSLNSSRYPETAKLLGAALFQDLKDVAGIIESQPEHRRPAAVAVDEFAAFGTDSVLGVFQRARSAGISLLLATQELADLRRVDPAFQDQVLGNVETIIAHRQNVPESAELVAAIAGTRTVTLGRYRRYRREAIEEWLASIEAGAPHSRSRSRAA
jgi:TraM recognition site of TraD and TraG/Type IV secretory system Conjugative DNA transfer